jgi:hypothetical protein
VPAPSPIPTPPGAPEPGSYAIDAISADGSVVTLDDGSSWTIAASGQAEVEAWVLGDEVELAAGTGSTYTLSDTTIDDGVAVAAKYAGTG